MKTLPDIIWEAPYLRVVLDRDHNNIADGYKVTIEETSDVSKDAMGHQVWRSIHEARYTHRDGGRLSTNATGREDYDAFTPEARIVYAFLLSLVPPSVEFYRHTEHQAVS